jgi:hypothetical protein
MEFTDITPDLFGSEVQDLMRMSSSEAGNAIH